MRIKRASKTLNEPPQIMLTDLAFNLLIFFVVCASTEPTTGRKQSVPSSSKDQASLPQGEQNIEVNLTPVTAAINGEITALPEFEAKMKQLLSSKTKPEQRLVVVKSSKDTPYHRWIRVTGMI